MILHHRTAFVKCLYCIGLWLAITIFQVYLREFWDKKSVRLFYVPPVVPEGPLSSSFTFNRSYAVASLTKESIWSVTKLSDPLTLTNIRSVALQQARQRLDSEHLEILKSGYNQAVEPLRILIVSYFRSGSTFLGELLNHYPGTYYLFEPLQIVSGMGRVGGGVKSHPKAEVAEAVELLTNLLHCYHNRSGNYFEYTFRHRMPLTHNIRLMNGCAQNGALCYDPEFLDSFCRLHPIHVTKTVRLPLSEVRSLLHEFPELRVIYLTRDPRGIYHSRRSLAWCRLTPSCIEPQVFCNDILRDVMEALELRHSHPDRFLPLRYEDLVLNPQAQVTELLAFLGLIHNVQISWFIQSHTRPDAQSLHTNDPYSTFRNATRTANAWKVTLSLNDIEFVQNYCSDVIELLGYS